MLLEHGHARTLLVKGAPEDVIHISTPVEMAEGTRSDLRNELRAGLLARFQGLSAEGFRLLGIAMREEPDDQATVALHDETEWTFVGFAFFRNPPKASAGSALQLSRHRV